LLVTEDAVKAMAAGSVIVDMGAGPLGGNVAGPVPDAETVIENGVTVIGTRLSHHHPDGARRNGDVAARGLAISPRRPIRG
jgi:NAD/NADP transhydrogenase alpha subunit